MIEDALEDEQSKDDFKEYLQPLVEAIVDKYAMHERAKGISKENLIEAGWTHFDFALKKYKENVDLMLERKKELFYFGTYFTWFIRQGIIEYLNKNKP